MPRNPRNQIYPGYEDLPAAGRSGPLVRLWRIRTELLLAAALAIFTLTLLDATQQGRWMPFILLSSAISVPAATRTGRSWIASHVWCVISRHRLQRVCLETTMHTRAGRIPLVLWITPTSRGEKALILMRVGICAEEFEAYSEEIAAACWARSTTVYRHRTRSQFVVVEIVRRDEAPGAVSPGLDRLYGRRAWVSLRPDFEEPPDLSADAALTRAGH
ncbi:hypothetical protein FE391_26570 [Nonomuraea sp. KC401]|uniref:hypothetical protein n=1 Tax=unclassified Nonomuraea TaxID=2593643 RepID=UPI0010FD0D66|nr:MULTISPECIES: hypothetical protein [unclassified Nonomuraea]NBE98834.1 hypothetical protein [Nonomuraea sp. K271]TLF65078.1 hypothetical protein FE391_26570 [Nonomuraea sp. KC401]